MIRVAYVRGSNEVQIDLDSEKAKREFDTRLKILRSRAGLYNKCGLESVSVSYKKSITRGHAHVTLTFPDIVTELEAIALAAALGDDPIRVICNLLRVLAGRRSPILFFEKEKRDNRLLHDPSAKTRKVRSTNGG